jgi:hypothetical protein
VFWGECFHLLFLSGDKYPWDNYKCSCNFFNERRRRLRRKKTKIPVKPAKPPKRGFTAGKTTVQMP